MGNLAKCRQKWADDFVQLSVFNYTSWNVCLIESSNDDVNISNFALMTLLFGELTSL